MAARTVLTTNTLEEFRTTFNSLSTTDIGDPATLTTVATSVVGAINELNASSYSGFQLLIVVHLQLKRFQVVIH